MKPAQCPKCNGTFQEGFIADNTFPAKVIPAIWVEGSPEASAWSGKGSAKVAGKAKRRVQTFRCLECGYLESYATDEWPGSSKR